MPRGHVKGPRGQVFGRRTTRRSLGSQQVRLRQQGRARVRFAKSPIDAVRVARQSEYFVVFGSAEKVGAASKFTVLPFEAVSGVVADAYCSAELLDSSPVPRDAWARLRDSSARLRDPSAGLRDAWAGLRDSSALVGAPGQSRTGDLSLRRRLLYPLSYWGHRSAPILPCVGLVKATALMVISARCLGRSLSTRETWPNGLTISATFEWAPCWTTYGLPNANRRHRTTTEEPRERR